MENKLPKNISLSANGKGYIVSISIKKSANSNIKTAYIGTFESITEAIKKRDDFVIKNYNEITKGYLPRGISYKKDKETFQAHLNIKGVIIYIGCSKNINEIIEIRNNFIDSLK